MKNLGMEELTNQYYDVLKELGNIGKYKSHPFPSAGAKASDVRRIRRSVQAGQKDTGEIRDAPAGTT